MSTLVIFLALVGILGVIAVLVIRGAQPAMEPAGIHRGTASGHRRTPSTDSDPYTPAWRRLLSVVELALLTVVVGAFAAAVVAAVIVFVGSLLSSAI